MHEAVTTLANFPIQTLPGLSAPQAQALADLGLTTTEHLRRQGQSVAQRQTLAKTLAVPERYIAKWVILADLARLPSVGCTYNGLLLHAGVISVAQLADSAPPTLYTQIKRLHVKTMQRADLCPGPDQVSTWIQQAKQLQGRR
jgi:hypothetical protein